MSSADRTQNTATRPSGTVGCKRAAGSENRVTFTTNNNFKTIQKMKKMTCKQLGGVCELEFQADNFEKMAELSKKHGM